MEKGTILTATEEVVCKSHPHNYIIKKGENVTVHGYLMGKLVIRLGDHHESGYKHLPHCTSMLSKIDSNKFIKPKTK